MNKSTRGLRRLALSAWIATCGFASADQPACTACATAESPTVVVSDAGPASAAPRFYGSLDYLLFSFRDMPGPPLIQHVPTNLLTNPLDPNAPQTLFGNGIDVGRVNGAYAAGGVWINDRFAIDGSYAKFETKTQSYFISSPGDPSIGRYYVDVTNANNPNTYLIYANPDGSASGWINAVAPVTFWHADVNVRMHGVAVFNDRVDWLVGFRYADLRDGVSIQDFTAAPGNVLSYTGEDNFRATNQFYGGQIGANGYSDLGHGFNVEFTTKFAMGGVCQRAIVSGTTIERQNGVVSRVLPGDVLTQTTNIGEYERNQFAVVSEFLVKLGYQVTDRLSFTVGYDFMAISSVVRAGGVIDSDINPNVNPLLSAAGPSNAQRPAFAFNGSDFWAQGLTVGMALRY